MKSHHIVGGLDTSQIPKGSSNCGNQETSVASWPDFDSFPSDEHVPVVPTQRPHFCKRACYMQTAESLRALSSMSYKPSDSENYAASQTTSNSCSRSSKQQGAAGPVATTSYMYPRDCVVTVQSQPTDSYSLPWIPPPPPPPPLPVISIVGIKSKSEKISFAPSSPTSNNKAKRSSSSRSKNKEKNKINALLSKRHSFSPFWSNSKQKADDTQVHQDVTAVGPSSLQVFRWKLSPSLQTLYDPIIAQCEAYAKSHSTGWNTKLYSLTRQDIPLALVPGGLDLTRPLTKLVVAKIRELYDRSIYCDESQPHILKYDAANHQGVALHYDRCDVTAQLMLSLSTDYDGGGTVFPDANNTNVRLAQGEVLIHPGHVIHGGQDIVKGTRYLLIWFCQFIVVQT